MASVTRSLLYGRSFANSIFAVRGSTTERPFCRKTPEQTTKEATDKATEKSSDQATKKATDQATEKPSDQATKKASEEIFASLSEREEQLKTARPYETMPKLPMIPFFGSSWLYFPFIGSYSSSNIFEADLKKQRIYGDIVRERFGKFEIVSSYIPSTNEILSTEEGRYPARAEFSTLKAYREMRKEWYQPLGLVAMQGKEWEEFRNKVQPHVFRIPELNCEAVIDVAADLVELLKVKRDSNNEVSDLVHLMRRWALESVSTLALDTRLGCLHPNIDPESDGMRMINSVETQLVCMNKLEASCGNFPFWKFFPTPMWHRFVKAADVFTELVFKYIKETMDTYCSNYGKTKEKTILQNMLMGDDSLDPTGAMVAVSDIIMAGIDTTAHAASYFLYNLAKNPEQQQRLYEEITKAFPKGKKIVHSYIKYFSWCYSESLRILPVIRGNLRVFDRDVVVQGYRVPAGTAVLSVQQVFSKDPRFFKDADKFLPERYEVRRSQTHIQVFGIGKRRCLGVMLAQLEVFAVICQIIRRYRVEYDHEDIKLVSRLVNVPDRPIRMKFIDRD